MESETSESEYVLEENTSRSEDRELVQEPAHKKTKINGKKKVTDYFTVEQDPKSTKKTDKQGKCTLCTTKPIVLKMKNCGTSALKRHLQSKHPKIYEQTFGKLEHSTSCASSSASTNTNKENAILSWLSGSGTGSTINGRYFQQDKFQKLLVEYMVKNYLPFNFFEDEISLQVYKYLNPNAILPGRNKMNSLAMEMFGSAQNTLKSLLKKYESKISFSIDGWSSFSMKGYYGITAHFIDNNWKLHAILLDFVSAHGQHTGRWIDLTNSVQGITTDNTNSNFTFMNELTGFISDIDPKNSHFVCFAHILNLGARDFIKILDSNSEFQETETDATLSDSDEMTGDLNSLSPIKKIHCLGKKLKNSENLRFDFEKFCTTLNLTMAMPRLDVITKWNSTLDMLRWGLNMRKSINILCDNIENMKTLKPTYTEWLIIDRVCKYLNSFKTISKTLEGEAYCTLPMVIIGINMLLDKLEQWAIELDNNPSRNETDEKFIYSIQAAKDKIIKHYQRTNWMYCVELILDPRRKVETFSNTIWGKDLKKEAVKHFEEIFKTKYFQPGLQSTTASSSSSKDKYSEFDIDLLSLFKKSPVNQANEMAWRYEIDKFLSEPRAKSFEDILEWWKRHENLFPNLAKMAKDFLSTPASSAPVERQFSRAALTVTKIIQ